MKKLTDNNYVYTAIVAAFFRGWQDHAKSRTKIGSDALEVVSNFFFGKIMTKEIGAVSGEIQRLNEIQKQSCKPESFWPSHGAMIVKAYEAGYEEAGLFDSGKSHGAIDLPREEWIRLLDDEEASVQYVLGKAREFADRKYVPEESHFNAPPCRLVLKSCSSSLGTYHGSLQKGEVVQCGLQFVRINEVCRDYAEVTSLGTMEKAKVTSLYGCKSRADSVSEPFLVEGSSLPDKTLDGLVPTVESELKRIISKSKAKAKSKSPSRKVAKK